MYIRRIFIYLVFFFARGIFPRVLYDIPINIRQFFSYHILQYVNLYLLRKFISYLSCGFVCTLPNIYELSDLI